MLPVAARWCPVFLSPNCFLPAIAPRTVCRRTQVWPQEDDIVVIIIINSVVVSNNNNGLYHHIFSSETFISRMASYLSPRVYHADIGDVSQSVLEGAETNPDDREGGTRITLILTLFETAGPLFIVLAVRVTGVVRRVVE